MYDMTIIDFKRDKYSINIYWNNVYVLSIILIWYVNIQGANSCSLEGAISRLSCGEGGVHFLTWFSLFIFYHNLSLLFLCQSVPMKGLISISTK